MRKRKDIDGELVCKMYLDGKSENQLSKIFVISRGSISEILKRGGIKRRSQSEAEALKWANMTKEQRENQVKKAHESTKGIVMSEKTLALQAIARQSITKFVGVGEEEIASILSSLGFHVKKQVPFFRYNLDLLVNDWLIIEITSAGGDILLKDSHIEKTKKALENKMSIVWVKFSSKKQLLELVPEVSKRIKEIGELRPAVPFCKIIKCASDCRHKIDKVGRFVGEYDMDYFLKEEDITVF